MDQSAISIVWVKYSRPSLSKEPQCIVSKCFGPSHRSLEKPPSFCQDWDVLGYFFGKTLLHNLALHLELVSQNSRSRKTPNKQSEWLGGRTCTRLSRSKLTPCVGNARLMLDFVKFPSLFGSWIKILRVRLLCLVPESILLFTSNYGLKGHYPVQTQLPIETHKLANYLFAITSFPEYNIFWKWKQLTCLSRSCRLGLVHTFWFGPQALPSYAIIRRRDFKIFTLHYGHES